jgi:hypothetical protein
MLLFLLSVRVFAGISVLRLDKTQAPDEDKTLLCVADHSVVTFFFLNMSFLRQMLGYRFQIDDSRFITRALRCVVFVMSENVAFVTK